MESGKISQIPLGEADPQHFIEVGGVHTPNRSEIRETVLCFILAPNPLARHRYAL